MASLTGNSVASTYDSLLKIDNNGPIDASLRDVTDGFGNPANFQINDAGLKFIGNADFTTATITGLPTDINNLTGAVDLVAGPNITINVDGQNIEISGSAGGGDSYDLNATQDGSNVDLNLTSTSGTDDSVIQLTAGTNITLTRDSATEVTIDATGGGTPGGSDTQIQYNNGGAFGGTPQLTYNDSTNEVFIGGSGVLNLSAGADLTMAQGDLTMTDGAIEVSGSVTIAEGNNLNMTTGGVVNWANSIGSFKADGITWPNADVWGESLDTLATGETFATRTAISTTQGQIYNLRPSVGGWALADADAQDSAGGMLGVSPNGGSTNRFFIRGLISIQSTNVNGTSTSIGDIVYLSEEGGHFDTDAPSGTGDIVRKVGQIVDSYVSGRSTFWKIWFDPDWYYETA